jgi:hypothetical protein
MLTFTKKCDSLTTSLFSTFWAVRWGLSSFKSTNHTIGFQETVKFPARFVMILADAATGIVQLSPVLIPLQMVSQRSANPCWSFFPLNDL